MADLSGLDLQKPSEIEWNKFNPQSSYQAPPPAEGADGKRIVYTGTLPKTADMKFEADQAGFLQVVLDPITIVGPTHAGQIIRFTRASVKAYTRNGKDLNVNSFGKMLRAAGSKAAPQTNEQYVAAAEAVGGKRVTFTIDWTAKNRDTGETIKGYRSFPMDAQYGHAQSILHAGDAYNVVDNKGTITGQADVTSEVIFANAVLKNFVELNKVASAT